MMRKSAARNFPQNETHIGNGAYKEHLKLTLPLLALSVSADRLRFEGLLQLIAARSPPT